MNWSKKEFYLGRWETSKSWEVLLIEQLGILYDWEGDCGLWANLRKFEEWRCWLASPDLGNIRSFPEVGCRYADSLINKQKGAKAARLPLGFLPLLMRFSREAVDRGWRRWGWLENWFLVGGAGRSLTSIPHSLLCILQWGWSPIWDVGISACKADAAVLSLWPLLSVLQFIEAGWGTCPSHRAS